MTSLPYTLAPEGDTKRFGLVVLQVDETIEADFQRLLPWHVATTHVSRIPSGADLTPGTIAQMERNLAGAAALLPEAGFDVVAYACTSGTAQIGAEHVTTQVQAGCRTKAVTNPLTATQAAFAALNVTRVAIVSPYVDAVSAPLIAAFRKSGIEVPVALSFGEKVERNVARIDASSIASAARQATETGNFEAIFLSCTNLKTLDVCGELENELGMPIFGSNAALAWHMMQLADVSYSGQERGRLFDSGV